MSACRYFRDGRTSHPLHRERVVSSLNSIFIKILLTSLRGAGISCSFLPTFLFATHTCESHLPILQREKLEK